MILASYYGQISLADQSYGKVSALMRNLEKDIDKYGVPRIRNFLRRF
jgi:hypothetical protein